MNQVHLLREVDTHYSYHAAADASLAKPALGAFKESNLLCNNW